jgi:nitronate monooxygenase
MLGTRYPLILAPMSGVTTPALVAAVSNAGGLGCFAAGYLTPAQIREGIAAVRALTDRPFAVNLFVYEKPPLAGNVEGVTAVLAGLHRELGIAAPGGAEGSGPAIEEQLAAVLEARVPVFSFAFGVPTAAWLEAFRKAGTGTIGTATTVAEAEVLERAGVDMVCAQGGEAGGHRGTFLGTFEAGMGPMIEQVRQMAGAVKAPVIAAGGIRTGADVRAALDAGAVAVQMGTAFIVCRESSAPRAYKEALLRARPGATEIIKSVSGRPTRGLANRLSRALDEVQGTPPYPWQHWMTRAVRAAAGAQGNAELMGLWSGEGKAALREAGAAELVELLMWEAGVADG